jgi:hypothetical protein
MEVNMDLTRIKKLIDDFKSINVKNISTEPTFMDIAGFPHYENVCSNILKFFFQSEETHGLKDLFIQALLKAIGEKTNHEIIVNEVIREQVTNKGNRIDIVIITDEFVVGIENKIYAGVYNDLDDYSAYLNSMKNDRNLYRVILSIYSIPSNDSGFVNIRYSEFFSNIDKLIGDYWHDGNQKYLVYLKDFMQTIRRIEGGTKLDNDLANFFNENLDDTQNLMKAINEMKKSLRQRVQDLGTRIIYDENKCKQWFWRDNDLLLDDLVHDIYVDDAVVAIDANTYPVGWSIFIWLRKAGKNSLRNKPELATWLTSKGLPESDISGEDQDRVIYSTKFDNEDETSICLQGILDKLCK